MNKNMRTFAWTLAIAIATLAMPLTACSSDDSPAEGPRQLVASGLRAYAVMPTDTRLAAGALFTDEEDYEDESEIPWEYSAPVSLGSHRLICGINEISSSARIMHR